MNTILLQPTDVLFFRDGRPMTGSLAGHGAAWPMPDVLNHALHAALHRADLEGSPGLQIHRHRRGRSGIYSQNPEDRNRQFGSLLTAGPFPVDPANRWYFPRPKDAQINAATAVTLVPVKTPDQDWTGSSLPGPLKYAVGNLRAPEKGAGGEPWLSVAAFNAYLRPEKRNGNPVERKNFLSDNDLMDHEANVGIAIDPATGTTGQGDAEGKIYTAHYLRLREGFRLGLCAEAQDKVDEAPGQQRDLLAQLFQGHPAQIVVGGQQRVCSAELANAPRLPLPLGLTKAAEFTPLTNAKFRVKWVLLSPAIWPAIPAGTSKRGTVTRFHPGGWLPNWLCPATGEVLLRTVGEAERRRRRNLNAAGQGYASEQNTNAISARLVAAIVPKPQVVTGWALPNPVDPERGGAKSTHLAVPAGAVYYFEADTAEAALALATALNWHGATEGTAIKNRRSTLLGEKGFGLGVCGTWQFFPNVAGRSNQ